MRRPLLVLALLLGAFLLGHYSNNRVHHLLQDPDELTRTEGFIVITRAEEGLLHLGEEVVLVKHKPCTMELNTNLGTMTKTLKGWVVQVYTLERKLWLPLDPDKPEDYRPPRFVEVNNLAGGLNPIVPVEFCKGFPEDPNEWAAMPVTIHENSRVVLEKRVVPVEGNPKYILYKGNITISAEKGD